MIGQLSLGALITYSSDLGEIISNADFFVVATRYEKHLFACVH